jgi:uncharacterized membrane protein
MNSGDIQFEKNAVSAVECVSKGWEIVKPNYLMFFGFGILVVIMGCIPIVSWFLIGPILVGLYAALQKQYRGEQAEFGILFSGFSKFITALDVCLLLILPGIVLNTYNFGLRIAQALAIFDSSGLTGSAATIFAIVGFLLNVTAFVGSIVFWITFAFAPQLLADKNLPLMETIKLSAKAGWANFGGMLLLALLLGLMMVGGILVLCIGIFFVLPIIYAANTVAYRMVFPMANYSGQFNNPPSPQNYGNMGG